MSLSAASRDILVATVGRPHGVKGLVHLHAATEDPATVEDLGALHDVQGRAWSVEWHGAGIAALRDASGRLLADRDAAARMTNVKLFVERDRLPEPEGDEFYHVDLVGLEARDRDGELLGQIREVHDYGAGVSLEVAGGPRDFIVPFTLACVPEVNIAGGVVTVVPPVEIEVEGDLSGAGDVEVRA
ncbi:ribosome maturation factor RimM [Brytella acorum]|uniref:Ribosome maturation factor RimM n=1 Tax=Brytella acorum TaxID=2959299 RepID=A0AA35Y4B3_9PROT|nr:ribosome maturation factor RimM [Brytella acorum]MDF3624623.1 ribosome maturation factor RimM [Brytella acorum]CAI9120979.1 ribosome maturation factor RimM [Brytella acorum]